MGVELEQVEIGQFVCKIDVVPILFVEHCAYCRSKNSWRADFEFREFHFQPRNQRDPAMPSPKGRPPRTTKAVERFEGDLGHVKASGDTRRAKKPSKSTSISASKVNAQKGTPKGGMVNGTSTVKKTSTYTTKGTEV